MGLVWIEVLPILALSFPGSPAWEDRQLSSYSKIAKSRTLLGAQGPPDPAYLGPAYHKSSGNHIQKLSHNFSISK